MRFLVLVMFPVFLLLAGTVFVMAAVVVLVL